MKDFKIFSVPQIYEIYKLLDRYYGKQYWWPGKTPFEIMTGAVLTQNTNWQNVEKAILNLKKQRLLNINVIDAMPIARLAQEIKSSGFFRIKARRLKALVKYLITKYHGKIRLMKRQKLSRLRKELLEVDGIGEETADSILLYALDKPIFVIDAYTRRIFSRHKFFESNVNYLDMQKFFMANLPKSSKIYNEYHALIVRLAKDFCRSQPQCDKCVIKGF